VLETPSSPFSALACFRLTLAAYCDLLEPASVLIGLENLGSPLNTGYCNSGSLYTHRNESDGSLRKELELKQLNALRSEGSNMSQENRVTVRAL